MLQRESGIAGTRRRREGESQNHALLKNGIMVSNILYGDLEKIKINFKNVY